MNLVVSRLLALFGALVCLTPIPINASSVTTPPNDVAKYYLYTNNNPSIPQQLYIDNEPSVLSSNFDAKRLTKIIIHGWTKSYLEIPNNQLIDAYSRIGDYNLISIDWSAIASLDYYVAKSRAPSVGVSCGKFVRFLVDNFNLDVTQLVLIGHSMGAHIAGFCGKELQDISDNVLQLGAIVALDAAYPLYSYTNTAARLTKGDANFVLSIHTNGQLKGTLKPIGDASFYANNGRRQPGCGFDLEGSCAHARVVYIYAEALLGYSFSPYYECESYDEFKQNDTCAILANPELMLGDPLDVAQIPGIFSFTTNSKEPFGHDVQ